MYVCDDTMGSGRGCIRFLAATVQMGEHHLNDGQSGCLGQRENDRWEPKETKLSFDIDHHCKRRNGQGDGLLDAIPG